MLMLTWQSSHFAHVLHALRIPYFQFWMIYLQGFIPQTNRLFMLIVFLFTIWYSMPPEQPSKENVKYSYYAVVCSTFRDNWFVSIHLVFYHWVQIGLFFFLWLFVVDMIEKSTTNCTQVRRDASRKSILGGIILKNENRMLIFQLNTDRKIIGLRAYRLFLKFGVIDKNKLFFNAIKLRLTEVVDAQLILKSFNTILTKMRSVLLHKIQITHNCRETDFSFILFTFLFIELDL